MKFGLLSVLCVFSMWDYYIPELGGRVLDYLGIAFLFIIIGRQILSSARIHLKYSDLYIVLLLTMAPLVIAAYFQGAWFPATAVLVGASLVFGSYFYPSYSSRELHKHIGWLIAFHLVFFYAQYGAYKALGVLVDFHSSFNVLEPRTFNEVTGYFRAAGLFQEPNSFCLTIYMLNAVRIFLRESKFDVLFLASLFAIFVSESLWGFGAIVILVLLKVNFFRVSKRSLATLLGIVVIAFGGWSVVKESPDILVSVLDPITVARITTLDDDPSRKGRFGGEADFEMVSLLFGRGLSTSEFQTFLGANGIGFYIFSFGVVGLVFFVSWIFSDAKKNRLGIVATVLFAMTSYPLFTYAFWWAWLAILVQVSKMPDVPVPMSSYSGRKK